MSKLSRDSGFPGYPIQALRLGNVQRLDVGAGSVQSDPFGPDVTAIEVVADTDCHIAISYDPTATTDSWFLPAGLDRAFSVEPGMRLAVIQKTEGGALWLNEAA